MTNRKKIPKPLSPPGDAPLAEPPLHPLRDSLLSFPFLTFA
ncbi:hypothetical protein Pla111_19150 [Botrimarina hoheduenensis]|uniref:Uncharacterized protein n=1 Tax=Botrimarina hoheduenensis TaxID=2528000 RepID=A0A5C5W959_9BACT|nr:hypothetical protein Pla111_19150 [Botrimarina hoheduenensis]